MVTIYCVASIKGGVGKTTIAGNLGVAMARARRKVLVVDADLANSSMGTIFGFGERPVTLHDLLAGKGEVSKAIYDIYGVHVLPSGPTISGFLRADPTRLKSVISSVSREYDCVIVDTPPGISKHSLAPLKLCDEVLIVVTPDQSAIDAAAKLEAIADVSGVKVKGVIVNKVPKPSFLGKLFKGKKTTVRADIQRRVKSPIIGAIPEDRAVPDAARLRRPVVLLKPKSAASKAFYVLAGKLVA